MNLEEKIQFWKIHANQELKLAMEQMDRAQLSEAFTQELTFGTSGLRGIIGPGTNRMNIYSIIKATYGYAQFLLKKYIDPSAITILIGSDNRRKREIFTTVAAHVLSSFGIKVIYSLIIPTPTVSYCIRKMKLQGGIILTASHNPPAYNGYKVYNEVGYQILPQEASEILAYSNEHAEYLTYKYRPKLDLITQLDPQWIDNYKADVMQLDDQKATKKIKIVYSPQHGTGALYVPNILEALGYEVIRVREQMSFDENFAHTLTPNPEDLAAYKLGIEYVKKNKGDLLITNDPDADRVGVMAYDGKQFKRLNGNEFSSLIFYALVKEQKIKNEGLLIYSNVSTTLCEAIARNHGISVIETLTGFKWIGEIISQHEIEKFIFGFEESYGCLIDQSISRDKDGIQGAIYIAKIANQAAKEGKTLWDILAQIYQKYGYYQSLTSSRTFTGLEADHNRVKLMNKLRKINFSLFEPNLKVIDYAQSKSLAMRANLIKIKFPSGSWVAIRPSGTEPKVRFYKMIYAKQKANLKQEALRIERFLETIMAY